MSTTRRLLLLALLSAPFRWAQAATPSPYFLSVEGHASVLSGLADRSLVNLTYGGGLRGGVRLGHFGLFLQAEENLWHPTDSAFTAAGVANLGVGGELHYGHDFVRLSLALGPSVLLYNTPLDRAGSVGLFIDLRPTGLCWSLSPRWNLRVDPLAFSLMAPVLRGIPLVQVEYRTLVAVEFLP